MAQYRRRHYLVKKGLQFRFLGWIVGSLLVVTLVTGFSVYFSLVGAAIEEFSEARLAEKLKIAQRIAQYEQARQDTHLTRLFPEANLLSRHEQETLVHMVNETNRRLIPKLLLLMGLIGLLSIFISHKVAGPVFRFERSVRELAGGNLTVSFKLRKGDEMIGLAQQLDQLTLSLRNRIERLQTEVTRLIPLTQAGSNLSPSAIEELKERLRNLQHELAQFRLK